MTELAVVTGVGGLVAVGFVAWQIGLRRRLESSLRRIPVREHGVIGPSSPRVAGHALPGACTSVSVRQTSSATNNSVFLSWDSGVLSWRLDTPFSLQRMGMKWRVGLVAVVAAAVLGGLVPHAVASGSESVGVTMVQAVESPLASPAACADATCGKGTPTPAAPTPGIVLAAVLAGLVVARRGAALIRRRPAWIGALPSGRPDPLFHPPQFS